MRDRKNEDVYVKDALFEAPDSKILATGDMFRGPYTGATSEIDLDNPGNTLEDKDTDILDR